MNERINHQSSIVPAIVKETAFFSISPHSLNAARYHVVNGKSVSPRILKIDSFILVLHTATPQKFERTWTGSTSHERFKYTFLSVRFGI
mmetsp:Transcript_24772/g.54390  ORF Transcript_24772/g.54390 Transcript_24772/m.54390 type:complete len:89 (-) Transcript_24772:456-722(-)